MKINLILLLCLPWLLLSMAISCRKCAIKNVAVPWDSISTSNLDNRDKFVSLSSNDSVPRAAFGIRVNFISNNAVIPNNTPDTCYYQNIKDGIKDLKIYCNYNFDKDHPQGAEVSELFRVAFVTQVTDAPFSYDTFYTIPEFIRSFGFYDNQKYIDLLLLKSPDQPGMQQFFINVRGKDSLVKMASTVPVILF